MLAVFGANMMPTPPFVVQNMIAGAMRIPLWKFMLGTFLALLPGMLAWTVFGDQISAALEDTSNVSYWLIGGALVLLVAFTFLARRLLRAAVLTPAGLVRTLARETRFPKVESCRCATTPRQYDATVK